MYLAKYSTATSKADTFTMRQDDINENVLNKLGVTCTFELTCLALFSSRVDLISSYPYTFERIFRVLF